MTTKGRVKLLDVVALTCDLPEEGLRAGQKGTVVEAYNDGCFEVEFADDDGNTIALLPLDGAKLRLLARAPLRADTPPTRSMA